MNKRVFTHENLENLSLNDFVPLSREELDHLKVRRVQEGDVLEVLDGQGHRGIGVYKSKNLVFQKISETCEAPSPRIHLFIGQIKFQNWEWLLEKCAEFGVASIQPFISEFVEKNWVVKGTQKRERQLRFLIDAVKQSGQPFCPQLGFPRPLAELIQEHATPPRIKHLVAMEPSKDLPSPIIPKPLSDNAMNQVALWVGPEGGWSDKDQHSLMKLDPTWISFPHGTFRTETAALFFMSNILYSTSDGNL